MVQYAATILPSRFFETRAGGPYIFVIRRLQTAEHEQMWACFETRSNRMVTSCSLVLVVAYTLGVAAGYSAIVLVLRVGRAGPCVLMN